MAQIKLKKVSGARQLQLMFNKNIPVYIEVDGKQSEAWKEEKQVSYSNASTLVVDFIAALQDQNLVDSTTAQTWKEKIMQAINT